MKWRRKERMKKKKNREENKEKDLNDWENDRISSFIHCCTLTVYSVIL